MYSRVKIVKVTVKGESLRTVARTLKRAKKYSKTGKKKPEKSGRTEVRQLPMGKKSAAQRAKKKKIGVQNFTNPTMGVRSCITSLINVRVIS